MIADITHHGRTFKVDLSKPLDLSIPLHAGAGQIRAWGVDPVRIEPVRNGDTVYAVQQGAPVNFRNIFFNPHGHGTHTESVGHISPIVYPVGGLFKRYFFTAQLLSIRPQERRTESQTVDHIITLEQMRGLVDERPPEALVLRTLPHENHNAHDWTDTNPPYVQASACAWLRSIGVKHLLLDLPSVDREKDGGKLEAHHAFWGQPFSATNESTITELINVPMEIRDGNYLLELQLANFVNDAAPSRPILYALIK